MHRTLRKLGWLTVFPTKAQHVNVANNGEYFMSISTRNFPQPHCVSLQWAVPIAAPPAGLQPLRRNDQFVCMCFLDINLLYFTSILFAVYMKPSCMFSYLTFFAFANKPFFSFFLSFAWRTQSERSEHVQTPHRTALQSRNQTCNLPAVKRRCSTMHRCVISYSPVHPHLCSCLHCGEMTHVPRGGRKCLALLTSSSHFLLLPLTKREVLLHHGGFVLRGREMRRRERCGQGTRGGLTSHFLHLQTSPADFLSLKWQLKHDNGRVQWLELHKLKALEPMGELIEITSKVIADLVAEKI